MNTQTVGYKAKVLEPWNLAIFVLINSVLPMLIFAPFILGILKWPSTIGPGLGILLVVGNLGPTIVAFVMTAITEGKPGSFLLYLNWLLLLAVIPIVIIFGAINLVRGRPEVGT